MVGIVASRLKERFHRPVIAFAPAGDGTLKGSGRSITGLHLRDVLERLDSQHPGLILKFGGHAMAAGLSLAEEQFPRFRDCFAQLVTEWLDDDALQGVIGQMANWALNTSMSTRQKCSEMPALGGKVFLNQCLMVNLNSCNSDWSGKNT